MDCKIPVVDISSISLAKKEEPKEEDYRNLSGKLAQALTQTGFVYITGHGVMEAVINKAREASLQFFQLEELVKTEHRMGPEYQGWVGQGREIFSQDSDVKTGQIEVRESYNVRDISPGGKFPDQNCPQLRPSLTSLASASHQLSLRLLTCLSLALGREPGLLASLHRGVLTQGCAGAVCNSSNLRSLLYPGLPPSLAGRSGVGRCGEHRDYGTITLLYQDGEGGLEARTGCGSWMPVPPVAGTVLVNVGEMLESLSGGRFLATLHRVVVPQDPSTARQSVVFFLQPDSSVDCAPLEGPHPSYPSVTSGQHLQNRVKAVFGDRL